MDNTTIRQWYLDQLARIPALNQEWIRDGISLRERAYRAWQLRHDARIGARALMDPADVTDLEARDIKKYGTPDGPTFQWLVDYRYRQGLRGDAIYEAIIVGAKRSDPEVDQRFGGN